METLPSRGFFSNPFKENLHGSATRRDLSFLTSSSKFYLDKRSLTSPPTLPPGDHEEAEMLVLLALPLVFGSLLTSKRSDRYGEGICCGTCAIFLTSDKTIFAS